MSAKVLLALIFWGGIAPAQEASAPVVSVVGASVSAGYGVPSPPDQPSRNDTIHLGRLLASAWSESGVDVKRHARATMFLNPLRNATSMIDASIEEGAGLIVAVDFMFWFGYGPSASDEEACLALQEQGLAQLDRVQVPILVGDYPDMRAADPAMLPPRYVRGPELLKKLNDRLRAWAEGKDHVRVLELSTWVKTMQTDGEVFRVNGAEHRATAANLLQSDRLHSTRLGMALLAARIDAAARSVLPDGHPLLDVKPDLADFIRASGAELDP